MTFRADFIVRWSLPYPPWFLYEYGLNKREILYRFGWPFPAMGLEDDLFECMTELRPSQKDSCNIQIDYTTEDQNFIRHIITPSLQLRGFVPTTWEERYMRGPGDDYATYDPFKGTPTVLSSD